MTWDKRTLGAYTCNKCLKRETGYLEELPQGWVSTGAIGWKQGGEPSFVQHFCIMCNPDDPARKQKHLADTPTTSV